MHGECTRPRLGHVFKEKRRTLHSLKARTRSKLDVALAEFAAISFHHDKCKMEDVMRLAELIVDHLIFLGVLSQLHAVHAARFRICSGSQ